MDIHLRHAAPTDEERAAVDALLGPAASAWDGGERGDLRDAHIAIGGRERASSGTCCCPALQALQSRVGWISEAGLDYVCERLSVPPADAWGVATFYALLATSPRPRRVLHVCDDIACRCRAPTELIERARARASGRRTRTARRATTSRSIPSGAVWMRSPCLGLCDHAPAAFAAPRPATRREKMLVARSRPRDDASALCRRRDERRCGRQVLARCARMMTSARSTRSSRSRTGILRAAAPRRHGRPDEPRRLPRRGRLRRAAQGARDRARGGDSRGDRVEAHGPRRRRVSHRTQVGRGRQAGGAPALPRLQRRRIGARHVQGSRAARRRSVRDRRGDDDRGVRHGLRARLPLHARRVPARRRAHAARDRRSRAPPASSATTSSAAASRSTSRSAAAPARTSAAKRRRSSSRSRAIAASRATSRPFPCRRDCSASRRS